MESVWNRRVKHGNIQNVTRLEAKNWVNPPCTFLDSGTLNYRGYHSTWFADDLALHYAEVLEWLTEAEQH
jgi:hypothetical protein